MLPARHRLRTAADFTATVRGAGGARSGGRLLVLHARDRDPVVTAVTWGPRVGFVVSKAVGGAVTRNRTKRVLRHLVADRLHGHTGERRPRRAGQPGVVDGHHPAARGRARPHACAAVLRKVGR